MKWTYGHMHIRHSKRETGKTKTTNWSGAEITCVSFHVKNI